MGIYDSKRVVITGGTTGMGLATAELLLGQGARVLVTGRTEATLDAARKQLGDNAIVVHSDAASLTDIDALADRVKTEFGTVDLLFVNAGIGRFVAFEDTDEATYDEVLGINAKGPFFTVQKLAPLIEDGGAVVLTTSIVNVAGFPLVSAYAASKAALRSLTRSLARELLPRNIRVNAVSPGPITTPILGKTKLAPEAAEALTNNLRDSNPMQRFGTAEEIAKAVRFLGFEATFTTGAELAVDGGASQL
ncbi:SDR family oxidoreductase [Nocardia sp. NPDC088792]|uniref:SDR family oxidoreductase n=1 Tax=Nocardia sp. NPDC088792 TaxID=3364332 RepID=UPI003805F13A